MDEPTNDLDIETMELLEEYLINYSGTVLLVSHDRAFVNNVVTSTLVFEGAGNVKEYVGGYDDWLRQRAAEAKPVIASQEPTPIRTIRPKTKFGFRQQQELDTLTRTIQSLETEQENLYQAMGDPNLYKNDKSAIIDKNERLETVKQLLAATYLRWEELEQLKINFENRG
jgi:ATP-binding cassette subfamily F protein uup